jgi:Icc-related predicted phosphoesterase
LSEHLTRIVASCEPRGHEKEVGRLIEAARESGADALALLGDLGDGGEEFRQERLGTSLVVAPGRLSGGEYALVDIHEREAERKKL